MTKGKKKVVVKKLVSEKSDAVRKTELAKSESMLIDTLAEVFNGKIVSFIREGLAMLDAGVIDESDFLLGVSDAATSIKFDNLLPKGIQRWQLVAHASNDLH